MIDGSETAAARARPTPPAGGLAASNGGAADRTTGRLDRVVTARSLLFVPADRPERFQKASASGADLVILDLEDAVGQGRKDLARQEAIQWLRAGHHAVVRINSSSTPEHHEDLRAVTSVAPAGAVVAVMVPKVRSRNDIISVTRRLGVGVPLIALIESAKGLANARSISEHPAVARSAFGGVDLAVQLGVEPVGSLALRHARAILVLAAAAAGSAAPIDGVTTSVNNPERMAIDLDEAASLGFAGKLAIHPDQVRAINDRFSPSRAELDWAARISSVEGLPGAQAVDGEMVDQPVRQRAQAILARGRALGMTGQSPSNR